MQTKTSVYTPTFIFLPNCLHSALNAQIALIFNALRSVDTIKNRMHHCVHASLTLRVYHNKRAVLRHRAAEKSVYPTEILLALYRKTALIQQEWLTVARNVVSWRSKLFYQCFPVKRKHANELKHQAQALMGATRLASEKCNVHTLITRLSVSLCHNFRRGDASPPLEFAFGA